MNVRRIHNKVETTLSLDAALNELPANAQFYQVENITFAPWDTLLLPYLWGLQHSLGGGIVVYTGVEWHKELGVPADFTVQASKVRSAIHSAVLGSDAASSDELGVVPDYSLLEVNGKVRRSVARISRNPWGCCSHAMGDCNQCCANLFC